MIHSNASSISPSGRDDTVNLETTPILARASPRNPGGGFHSNLRVALVLKSHVEREQVQGHPHGFPNHYLEFE